MSEELISRFGRIMYPSVFHPASSADVEWGRVHAVRIAEIRRGQIVVTGLYDVGSYGFGGQLNRGPKVELELKQAMGHLSMLWRKLECESAGDRPH